MGTFEITSAILDSEYTYKDENVIVRGTFKKDSETNVLQTIDGVCYRSLDGEIGERFGNFFGTPADGDILFDLSKMSRTDSNHVWDAIDVIETRIINEQED